jgi:hypothetical protein
VSLDAQRKKDQDHGGRARLPLAEVIVDASESAKNLDRPI